MKKVIMLAACALIWAVALSAQVVPPDVAQAPRNPKSSATIAPANEPGTRLVVSGTVVGKNTKKPLPRVVVYAYHTDAQGYYTADHKWGEAGENDPRLKGWARTDASGHFEFTTIRPAHYADRYNVPAHIHVNAWGAGYPRQWFMIEFKDDPLLPRQHFTDNTADFLYIVPVTKDAAGVEHCSVTIQMCPETNFPGKE